MKSIMQEASSIAKAIEQAWVTAGQPAEFTVKVLEEPQKNFIGFTTRSAKIALFFDMPPTTAHVQAKQPPAPARPRPPVTPKQQQEEAPKAQPSRTVPEREVKEIQSRQPQAPRREYKPLWNDAMITFAKQWVQETLSLMGLGHVNFTIEPSDFYLRITFDKNLMSDQTQEKRLFASLATLIIETLKRTFKTGLRGHKIVLIPASHHDSQS